jgi:hypothetical protein
MATPHDHISMNQASPGTIFSIRTSSFGRVLTNLGRRTDVPGWWFAAGFRLLIVQRCEVEVK